MAIMKTDKDMKRGNINSQYANNVVAVKWFDNRGVVHVLRVAIKHQQCQNICPMPRDYQRLQLRYGWCLSPQLKNSCLQIGPQFIW